MTTYSPEAVQNAPAELPYPIEQLPKVVYETFDREQIAELLIDKLTKDDIDPNNVIFSGFDATDLLRNGGSVDRTGTFGVGAQQMLDSENASSLGALHNPVKYLETDAGMTPSIEVYELSKLKGGIQELDAHLEVSPEELKKRPDLIYWETRDGSPLYTTIKKLFLF